MSAAGYAAVARGWVELGVIPDDLSTRAAAARCFDALLAERDEWVSIVDDLLAQLDEAKAAS